MNLLLRLLLLIGGIFVSLGGLLGVGMGILAILDPVGTKLADDTDPFGTPPSILGSIVITIVCAMIVAGGFVVIWFSDRTANRPYQ